MLLMPAWPPRPHAIGGIGLSPPQPCLRQPPQPPNPEHIAGLPVSSREAHAAPVIVFSMVSRMRPQAGGWNRAGNGRAPITGSVQAGELGDAGVQGTGRMQWEAYPFTLTMRPAVGMETPSLFP